MSPVFMDTAAIAPWSVAMNARLRSADPANAACVASPKNDRCQS